MPLGIIDGDRAGVHHLRLALDQIPIAEKSNEIPALKPLLQKI
jgi:hypothetical protein